MFDQLREQYNYLGLFMPFVLAIVVVVLFTCNRLAKEITDRSKARPDGRPLPWLSKRASLTLVVIVAAAATGMLIASLASLLQLESDWV